MKVLCLFVLLFAFQNLKAQSDLNIVPAPAEFKRASGNFLLNKNTVILAYGSNQRERADILNYYLEKELGFTLSVSSNIKPNNNAIIFSSVHVESKFSRERYTLRVKKNRIEISSKGKTGVFYAAQTLLQLMAMQKEINSETISIPQLSITDYPRFNYRGMHLDVCRHFMPVELVKQYIDYLAMYKFNTFHWHLTEDQGWRIEIKKYPKLTEVGAWRNGTIVGSYPGTGNDGKRYGGYYTQEQIKDVVKYAAERYITIIPEIEMPGHSSAAIAAYPELSCFPNEDTKYPTECAWAGPTKGKQVQQTWGVFEDVFCPSEYTFKFLEDVIDEVIELFPSQYIHIGGDECPKDNWKRSPFCQQLMKEKGLKDEHELQSYFIQRIEKYINSKGKKIIGWDEILEGGLAPNATVMSWRGEAGGIAAAKQKHDVVMTPEYPLYLNHSQTKNEDSITQGGYNPLEAVYNYEPIPKELTEEEGKYVLGAQGNVWSEYIDSKSKLEYSVFPRMAALAEVLWSPKEKRDWKDFERRLPVIFERMDKAKTNYSKAYYTLVDSIFSSNNRIGWILKSNSPFIIKAAMDYDINKTSYYKNDTSLDKYNAPIEFYTNSIGAGILYDEVNKKIISKIERRFYFNKATGKKISLSTPPDAKYPGDGAFTLVNGVQNTKGFSNSSEFLGFNGKNCEAVIDLGKTGNISKVTAHTLHQAGDWIWRPITAEVFVSDDGINFKTVGLTDDFIKKGNANGEMAVNFEAVNTRFVKVLISNWGTIPAGNSGSGNPAWLFVDEIEVE